VAQSPIQNAPKPNFSYVSSPSVTSVPKTATKPARPVSIHSFSSLQSQPSVKPLSPLPLLQTNFPQYSNAPQQQQFQQPPPQQQQQQQHQQYEYQHQPTSFSGSPRGWAHVQSPRSPGAANQHKPIFYNNAQVQPPFDVSNSAAPTHYDVPLSSNNYGQPQVRS
jgi:hypothetical protein